jgi:hypothetical protein
VDCLLDELGFGLRKPRKVKMMGQCADRDAPLEKIGALKARYLKPGPPVAVRKSWTNPMVHGSWETATPGGRTAQQSVA